MTSILRVTLAGARALGVGWLIGGSCLAFAQNAIVALTGSAQGSAHRFRNPKSGAHFAGLPRRVRWNGAFYS